MVVKSSVFRNVVRFIPLKSADVTGISSARCHHHAVFELGLFFSSEYEGDIFLQMLVGFQQTA